MLMVAATGQLKFARTLHNKTEAKNGVQEHENSVRQFNSHSSKVMSTI